MSDETGTPGKKLWTQIPVAILCLSVFLAILLADGGGMRYLGPGKAERDRKKQAWLANRTLLTLQLAKCQRYKSSANDAYICGGSSLIYQSLASSGDCELAREAARELGIAARDFTIPLKPTPKPASGT
ncbi:MAG: hypothetical protein LIP28_06330 [Deltaproteobacteria bacterium]|nr:hypothetical protein [Deltaproteobacteria bacterium]